jgi:hypothetical protein
MGWAIPSCRRHIARLQGLRRAGIGFRLKSLPALTNPGPVSESCPGRVLPVRARTKTRSRSLVPFSTFSLERLELAGLPTAGPIRLPGLVTRLACYAFLGLVPFVSPGQRSWDLPFEVFVPRTVAASFDADIPAWRWPRFPVPESTAHRLLAFRVLVRRSDGLCSAMFSGRPARSFPGFSAS